MASTSTKLTQRLLNIQKVLAYTGVCKTFTTMMALGLNSRRTFYLTKGCQSISSNTSTDLHISVQNGVRTITFNRPHQKNALTLDMFKGIIETLHESNKDENTTIVASTGTGDYFTSGMDMKSSFKKGVKKDSATVTATESNETNEQPQKKSRLFPFLNAIVSCKKPIIALVNGAAIGVGVTMLGLMDGVYACESASFQTIFTKYGLIPEMSSTYTYPRIMGYCRANRILLWNEKRSAMEAYECGLVSRLFRNEDFGNCKEILEEYASNPTNSLVFTKQLVRGREKDLLYQICEDEQQRFDPEMAKKVKEQFLARKNIL